MKRTVFLLDREWKFLPEKEGETAFSAITHADSYRLAKAGGVEGPGGIHWDDSGWRVLNVPHDYFSETPLAPHNLHSHGYHARDNGWYRKTFRMDESLRGQQFLLCLEGVAVEAEVYFNGSLLSRSFSAYNEWTVDLTDRMHFGNEVNVLAVYFNGFKTEGWWYEGAGIYRHVRLFAKAPLHVAHNGLFVKPIKRETDWLVETQVTVENTAYEAADYALQLTLSREGEVVAQGVLSDRRCGADTTDTATFHMTVTAPDLWDIDHPNLYHAAVRVWQGGEEVDREETDFGFRTIRFDANEGFFLNDRPLKLKGVCCHQDHAGVGTAVPDSIQHYRIRRLKEMGANAYRAAHNLPAREILDACDRLGVLVMDENRRFESTADTISHVETMVRRDRNHPSVILYSLFNEENLQSTAEGRAIFCRLKSAVKRLDDSRPVSGAMNGGFLEEHGVASAMDVTGINYSLESIPAFHEAFPNQPLFGSENDSALSTRGCYASDREGAQVLQDYGDEVVPWGSTVWQAWDFTRRHNYMAGIFIWTGFDYRGEPLPFGWPSCSSQFGLLDTCGFEKEGFYQAKACFTDAPFVHIAPHWNWQAGDTVRVQVVTNGDMVELRLNGRSLGQKAANECAPAEWHIPFEAGELTATAYRNGEPIATDRKVTTGAPVRVRLIPDRVTIKNDGMDTVPVAVCVEDEHGNRVPTAACHVRFSLEGDGEVIGVGNGDPNSHESDKEPQRSLFAGWAQALVQSRPNARTITLTAEVEGLTPDRVEFAVEAVEQPHFLLAAVDRAVDGWTMSPVYAACPDANMVLTAEDMNSFAPVSLGGKEVQAGLQTGYRLYRAFVQLPLSGQATLRFARVCAAKAEVFVNGALAAEGEGLNGVLSVSLCGEPKETVEVRVRLRADGESAGMCEGVQLES